VTGPPAPLTILYLDINTEWRGGQRQLLWMGEGLRRHGGRPIFALRTGVPLAARARATGIEVIAIDPLISGWGPWTVLRLRSIIRREHVSIVHAQSGHTMSLAALAAAGTRARIVFARRVTTPLRDNRPTRWKYARADRLISVSRAGVEGLLRAGVDPARVRVVPSGVPLEPSAIPATTELLETFGVPVGAPLAVMVASLSAAKDPATFVRAIVVARREVSNLHALLVGDGPLRTALAAQIAALGLEGIVHLTGFRTDPESLESAAGVVVLSSRSLEGTPGVLLDALVLGKSIVATKVGGVPEVIEDDQSGLIVPIGDAEALGRAIARVLLDTQLSNRLSAGARSRAPMFSIERTVDRTMEVYRELLAERSSKTTHLLLTSNFPPQYDGIASWMSQLAIHYGGDAMLVSVGREPGDEESDARQTVRLDRMPIPRERLRNFPGLVAWSQRAAKLARIHGVSFTWCGNLKPASYVALSLRLRMGVPYGVILHGTELLLLRARGRGFAKLIARALLGSAAVIVTNSEWTRGMTLDLLEELGIAERANRVYAVPLGADLDRFRAGLDTTLVRAKYGLTTGRWMLTVGRLVEHKGQDHAMRALSLLRESEPDLRYAIAGTGEHEDTLRALAARLGLADRVRFLGHVTDADLPSLYNVAELYLGASRVAVNHVEGFGISLIEAAATSLPVVAGREGGMPEAVVDGVTGLLADPYDPASIAESIQRILRSPELAARLGEAGRRVAESKYSWQRVARDLRAIADAHARVVRK
jgi:phosphatidyl-myo-inositol dimannoside synthase